MEVFALGGALIGLCLLLCGGDGGDDVPVPTGEPTPEEPEDCGLDVQFEEDEAGNPIFTAGTDGPDAINGFTDGSPVLAGAGNDILTFTNGETGQVLGGLDDDIIILEDTYFTDVCGGEGEDTIRVFGTSPGEMLGGSGDDTLLIEQPFNPSPIPQNDDDDVDDGGDVDIGDPQAEPLLVSGDDEGPLDESDVFQFQDEPTTLNGNAGEDSIRAVVNSDPNIIAPWLYGGEDADDFLIDINTTDQSFLNLDEAPVDTDDPVEPTATKIVARMMDFVPGEDSLVIDVRDTHDLEPSRHDFDAVEISEFGTGANAGTIVDVFFVALQPGETEATYTIVSRIVFPGLTGLTLDDFTILTPPVAMS